MVRGNWQKRVERTEARRAAAKAQRAKQKQRLSFRSNNDDKALRASSYRLLSEWLDDTDFFPPDPGDGDDSEECVEQFRLVVDVWTDARPKNRLEYIPPSSCLSSHDNDVNSDDDYIEDDDGQGKSNRSKPKIKDRGGFKKTKGRKSHPNTKRKTEEEDFVKRETRSNSIVSIRDERLCAKEFFFGQERCPAGKFLLQQRQKGAKRGGDNKSETNCNLRHYHQFPSVKTKQEHSPPLTLAQVVNEKYQHCHKCDDKKPLPLKVRDATLQYAFNAIIGTDDDLDGVDLSEANVGIESMYHTRINVARNADNEEGDDSDDKPEQRNVVLVALEQFLDREKMPHTSLIYLSIQGVLVYDLHRGGLIFSEAEEDFLVSGEDINVDAFLQHHAVDIQSKEPSHIHEQLTHHVLDDILSYLPDEAVAVLPQVCKSWRDEVGAKSPQLWKMLLKRHNWPYYSKGSQEHADRNDVNCSLNECKDAFISHYGVARDIRAIASAASSLLLSGGSSAFDSSVVNNNFAMQRFKSTIGAPVLHSDPTVKIQAWSGSIYEQTVGARALAAYPDFTIRLFEVVTRSSTLGSQSSSGATRPMKCRQIACVGVLPPSLTRWKGKGENELEAMAVDDDNVACLFRRKRGQQSISSFLSIVSREDLVCCGKEGLLDGNSLHEVDLHAIALDFLLCGLDTHQDNLQTALHEYLAVWDGDTSHITLIFTSNLVSCGGGYFLVHAFIDIPLGHDNDEDNSEYEHSPSSGSRLFLLSIKRGTASIVKTILHFGSHSGGVQIFASEPYKLRLDATKAIAGRKMCTNIMVTSDIYGWVNLSLILSKDGDIDVQMKSIKDSENFHSLNFLKAVVTSSCVVVATDSTVDTCLFFLCDGGHESYDMVSIGGASTKLDDIFCIREDYVAVILGTRQANAANDDDVTGVLSSARVIVVYLISSRQELFRYPLPAIPISLGCTGDTIAANVSNLGFVIAGGNAREVARTSIDVESCFIQNPTKTAKAKKKRLASLASGRKKDGFARGMSMRG